jgi:hypothetical protein
LAILVVVVVVVVGAAVAKVMFDSFFLLFCH